MLLINDLIEKFRALLVSSWPVVRACESTSGDGDFLNNWLEANWEMILEGELSRRAGRLVVLEPYGHGAEDLFHGIPDGVEIFDRVSLPTLRPNHVVVCTPKAGVCLNPVTGAPLPARTEGYPIFGFGCIGGNGRFEFSAPFDVCVLKDGEFERLCGAAQLDYWLVPNNRDGGS